MTINLNGRPREVADGTTLGDLLTSLGVARAGIAVARNYDIVLRSTLDATLVRDGDTIEIISAVAGG